MLAGAFVGTMTTQYEYEGSFGAFEDSCTGDVSLAIDDDLVLTGTGLCVFDSFELGFDLEGQQTDLALRGVLISESATDRVETPFSGSRDNNGLSLSFDTTHEADGEAVRLFGSITASLVR